MKILKYKIVTASTIQTLQELVSEKIKKRVCTTRRSIQRFNFK